ncbi:hypothetical protein BCR33DRAFT_720765 [Rhizoclosmatium globosum]|uniref:Uncharacterized protein n=1 Tax=Rhizoclosmatium globosum TaxID=329046 RepID=A0A1Y2BUG3_9FUNG|nr:hypothetical protein BCR33DRAFT_720765 [Rhizoclosmatium globosum]|eukprot:ORY38400.1 hypothetical protein BCR33DRAFT_720765 [Rhizoclosmatium globosum]
MIVLAISLGAVNKNDPGGGSSGGNGGVGKDGGSGGNNKLPPAKKWRIVKGRLEYVVVGEVEGRLDEGGIDPTSRQTEDDYPVSQ